MTKYEKVNENDVTEPESPALPSQNIPSSSSVPAQAQPIQGSSSSTSTSTRITATQSDGVFSNLSAKPVKTFEEIEPPSYVDATAPSNTDARVVDPSTIYLMDEDNGEILIEGMPVGNMFILFMNMLISMTFDLVGFLLTALLAQTHAAKTGSRLGLGLTFIRYSILIRSKESEREALASTHFESMDSPETTRAQKEWTSYVLFFFGFLLVLHSNVDYFRVLRLRNIIQSRSVTESRV